MAGSQGARAPGFLMRHLALLRGVNVGGARTLPMRDLEAAFRAAGASGAGAVIQSGNVVFEADRPDEACAGAAANIRAKFGFLPTIVLRRAAAWRAMVEANPFVAAGAPTEDPSRRLSRRAAESHAYGASRSRRLPARRILRGGRGRLSQAPRWRGEGQPHQRAPRQGLRNRVDDAQLEHRPPPARAARRLSGRRRIEAAFPV